MEYTFKPNLFVTEAGFPMLFYIERCATKDQIASYIQYGGGWIVDSPSGPHTLRLVDDDYTPCDGEDVFSSDFILTSCKRNMLPKLGSFRRGKDNILNEDFDLNRILEMKTTWSEAKQDETTSSRQLTHDKNCSSSDSSVESISEKVTHPAKRRARYREPFSDFERIEIVDYLVKTRRYSQLGGCELWKHMEHQKVCHGRTWQSLKEHFRKRILPQIDSYHLPAHIVESFKKRTECMEKNHTANVQNDADRSLTPSETSKEVTKSVEKKRASPDLEASISHPEVKRGRGKSFNPCATPESSAAHTAQSVDFVKPHGLGHDINRYYQLYKRQLLKEQKGAMVKSTSAINEPLCNAVTSTSNLCNATNNPRQIACLLDSEKERHESLLNAPNLTPTLTLHNPGTSSTSYHKPDCHRKYHSPSIERPASPALSFTPQECVKGDAPETDSEIIPSVLKPVNASSQVMELESEISPWFQCTPEEIFMEEVVSNSGDDCGETVDPLQGEINCSDKEDASLFDVDLSSREKDSSPGSRMEEAFFQDLNEWSDDGLYWRGNVFPLKSYSEVVPSTSKIGETSMKAIHHVESTSNKCNPRNRVSSSFDVDSKAETWKCYVKESRKHKQRENLCCRKKSGCLPHIVSHWLESTPKGSRVPHAHHEKVTEQEMTSDDDHNERESALMHDDAMEQENSCAEDHSVRERPPMLDVATQQKTSRAERRKAKGNALLLNPEVSYSRLNFLADLTDLGELEEHHPRNSPKKESNMLKKLNSPKITIDISVQTDPIKICDPEVCGRVSNSLIFTSQTKEMCTSSEDPLLTSLCISPIKGPTSAVSDSSVVLISPQRPVTPGVVYEGVSPVKTRSLPKGVRSPLSARYLPL